MSAQGNPGNELLRFINTKDVLLTGTKLLTKAKLFLQLEGAASEGIIVDGGDLRKAEKPIVFIKGAAEKSSVVRS